ncbi:MAG: hypothetical protein ACFFAO_00175 [Candidatus Hermodarchaeota archaeon]
MVECELIEECPFFTDKLKNMPATTNLFKEKYCKTDSSKCARYIVIHSLGKSEVPSDLFPNQLERANGLIHNI